MFDIYKISEKFGLLRNSFAAMEIGVGPVDKCRLANLISKGYNCHLVEALPKYQAAIGREYGGNPNVTIRRFAISDKSGTEQIFDRGEGSWITKLPSSPDTQNNNVRVSSNRCSTVQAITLDEIDPGNLDVVLIDIEGAEWYALQNMVSRPEIIVLETHLLFHKYINPYISEIESWMSNNRYVKIATEAADTMWCKE